jgi:hypothetical protein
MKKIDGQTDTARYHAQIRKMHEDQSNKIERNNEIHKKNLQKLNENHAQDLASRREELQQNLESEMLKKNEHLDNIKTSFKQTQNKMQNQLSDLENFHRSSISNVNKNYQQMSNDQSLDKSEHLETLNKEYQASIQKIHNDGKLNLAQAKENTDRKKTISAQTNERDLERNKYLHNSALQQQEIKYTQSVNNLEIENERNINKLKSDYYTRANQQNQIFEQDFEKKSENYDKLIAQENKDFEQRYKALVDDQKKLIDKVNQKSQQIINEHKKQHAVETQKITNQSQDQFYKIRDIEPTIVEHKSHVEIKIPVAEHEKENLRLNILKRKLKLTLDRKFEDHIQSPNSKLTNTKVETLSKEIHIDQLLDPKKVERNYVDGQMVYNIAKL